MRMDPGAYVTPILPMAFTTLMQWVTTGQIHNFGIGTERQFSIDDGTGGHNRFVGKPLK